MKIRLNPDEEIVRTVKEGLERKGGYCPCRLQRTEEYKCMCEEFKAQIKDPEFEDIAIACFTTRRNNAIRDRNTRAAMGERHA